MERIYREEKTLTDGSKVWSVIIEGDNGRYEIDVMSGGSGLDLADSLHDLLNTYAAATFQR